MGVFETYTKNLLSDENLTKISNTNLGSRSFNQLVPDLHSLREVLEMADPVYAYLTNQNRNEAINNLRDLEQVLSRIFIFDPGRLPEPAREFDAIVEQIPNIRDRIVAALLPATGMAAKIFDLADIKREGEEIVSNLRQIQGVERSIQGLEATVHASTFFESQSERHGRNAKKFMMALAATVVIAIISILFWNFHSSGSITNRVAYDLPALNILALTWFAIRFFSKNISTSQHLQELNQSKATVLRAGEQYGISSGDEMIKQQILGVVVSSTMNINDPGYLQSDSSFSPLSGSALSNMVKAFQGKTTE